MHAYRNAMYFAVGTDDLDLAIGPASDGSILEVGFIRAGGDVAILHSVPARKKFLR